jgi:NDP-sugar pyrophosphorylase family protein
MSDFYKTENLLDLLHTRAKNLFCDKGYPWQVLKSISEYIILLGAQLPAGEFTEIKEYVWVHKTAVLVESASIAGPCVIDAETEVRHCAFIRGSALIGKNCVIGNSTEIKNSILFDNVQTPHYNYIGDSILGYKAHLGAGAVTSNVKSNRSLVAVRGADNVIFETGLKKFGAIVGDYTEVGCNAVLNPGTILGRHSMVYPTSCVRGTVPENGVYKNSGEIVIKT